MSTLVMVVAESGRGKSTSLENLPIDSTFLINVMGKPLPFPEGAKYKAPENMLITAEAPLILAKLEEISRGKPNIKQIVIDDGQYIMATEFMQKAMIKGYDKFTIMARNIWDILVLSSKLRPDLKVFFLGHEESVDGTRMLKTLGRLLREKITPEGMSTIVLFGGVDGSFPRVYFFETQSDGQTTAHSPKGMFPLYIKNDLWLVSQRIDEYYSTPPISLEQSKLDFGNIAEIKQGGQQK